MIYHIMDFCPHCWKRNARFHLTNRDKLRRERTSKNTSAARLADSYGSVWVCQNCFKSLGASIFVVL